MELNILELVTEYTGAASVIFIAALAAVVDVLIKNKWKKKKSSSVGPITNQTLKMMEQAFDGLQNTTESLQSQYHSLQEQHNILQREANQYREKYYEQIEINTKQSALLTKLSNELILLQDKFTQFGFCENYSECPVRLKNDVEKDN